MAPVAVVPVIPGPLHVYVGVPTPPVTLEVRFSTEPVHRYRLDGVTVAEGCGLTVTVVTAALVPIQADPVVFTVTLYVVVAVGVATTKPAVVVESDPSELVHT